MAAMRFGAVHRRSVKPQQDVVPRGVVPRGVVPRGVVPKAHRTMS
jgi:hypothetical protein